MADSDLDMSQRIAEELFAMMEQVNSTTPDGHSMRLAVLLPKAVADLQKKKFTLGDEVIFPMNDSSIIAEVKRRLENPVEPPNIVVLDLDNKEHRLYRVTGDPGDNKSGACFIATAAYGSPFAPEVVFFRRFRDEVLLRSKIGITLVEVYYFISPPVASLISKKRLLARATRSFLLRPLARTLNAVMNPASKIR